MVLFLHHRYRIPGGEERATRQLAEILRTQLGEQVATLLARFSGEFPNATRRELMDRLTDLASGGFLEEAGDRWRFRSGLLRRYWAKWMK